MLIPEGLLQRMQRAALRESLHRQDLVAVCLHGEHRACLDGAFAVEDDDAAAAARRVTADVRAREPAVFAQEVRQQRPRFHVLLVLDAVHLDADLHDCTPRRASAWRRPRLTSTPARFFLYSTLPRRSACGSLFLDAA